MCEIPKLPNEFPPEGLTDECTHYLGVCLRVNVMIILFLTIRLYVTCISCLNFFMSHLRLAEASHKHHLFSVVAGGSVGDLAGFKSSLVIKIFFLHAILRVLDLRSTTT